MASSTGRISPNSAREPVTKQIRRANGFSRTDGYVARIFIRFSSRWRVSDKDYREGAKKRSCAKSDWYFFA
jgi:hypothetical protein